MEIIWVFVCVCQADTERRPHANHQPIPEFYEMLNDLNKRFDYGKENTSLPDKVDMDKLIAENMEKASKKKKKKTFTQKLMEKAGISYGDLIDKLYKH